MKEVSLTLISGWTEYCGRLSGMDMLRRMLSITTSTLLRPVRLVTDYTRANIVIVEKNGGACVWCCSSRLGSFRLCTNLASNNIRPYNIKPIR